MVFWQSPEWVEATQSIYRLTTPHLDPTSMSAWQEAWSLFRKKNDADVVLTMGARESLFYGLLCALSRANSKQIMCEVFIDDVGSSPFWKVKRAAYRLITRRCIGILTNSSAELKTLGQRFSAPPEKLVYVPMHTNVLEPSRVATNDGFVLAAGRSLRDFDTLLAALPLVHVPVVIICGKNDLTHCSLPDNVTILREVSHDEYMRTMRSCAAVVIPLLPTERSTGQVVMLEAMALGKPVVATTSPGTDDFLIDGETGWSVAAGDASALAHAMNDVLADPDRADAMAQAALDLVSREATIETHAARKLEAIAKLWRLGKAQ